MDRHILSYLLIASDFAVGFDGCVIFGISAFVITTVVFIVARIVGVGVARVLGLGLAVVGVGLAVVDVGLGVITGLMEIVV